jgi:hypothetical protein
MPLGVREVQPAKPQPAAWTAALRKAIARILPSRYSLAKPPPHRFFLCFVHREISRTRRGYNK